MLDDRIDPDTKSDSHAVINIRCCHSRVFAYFLKSGWL